MKNVSNNHSYGESFPLNKITDRWDLQMWWGTYVLLINIIEYYCKFF